MRQLSGRLRYLRLVDNSLACPARSLRFSSRYSNPQTRSRAQLPPSSQAASFTANHNAPQEVFVPHPDPQQNPYDPASVRREYADQRAYHLRRMRFAGAGLLLSVAGLAAVLYNVDLSELEQKTKGRNMMDAPPDSNAKFEGRPVHVIGAGEAKRIVAEGELETDLVETGTSSVPYFPRVVYLPSDSTESLDPAALLRSAAPNTSANPGNIQNEEEYTLVGLGIRTVSLFRIQVYVLGLYVRTKDISALQARFIHYINPAASTLVPHEKTQLRQALLDPTKSTEIWENVMKDTPVKTAWRIVPTRNTDFAHLRDGWITGIKRGTQAAAAALKERATGPAETGYESESFGESIRQFKDIFTGGGSAPKGSVVMMLRNQKGALDIFFQQPNKTQGLERMGGIQDPRIGTLVWMGYLAGKNVSSEAAREGVADGCVGFAGRPVGSVETMVT